MLYQLKTETIDVTRECEDDADFVRWLIEAHILLTTETLDTALKRESPTELTF